VGGKEKKREEALKACLKNKKKPNTKIPQATSKHGYLGK
jgi:hypothetical protein